VFCLQDVGLSEVSLEKLMGRTVELLEIMAQESCCHTYVAVSFCCFVEYSIIYCWLHQVARHGNLLFLWHHFHECEANVAKFGMHKLYQAWTASVIDRQCRGQLPSAMCGRTSTVFHVLQSAGQHHSIQ